MSKATVNTEEHRYNLAPVVATIFGLYLCILTTGYFVGNMIYQIP